MLRVPLIDLKKYAPLVSDKEGKLDKENIFLLQSDFESYTGFKPMIFNSHSIFKQGNVSARSHFQILGIL